MPGRVAHNSSESQRTSSTWSVRFLNGVATASVSSLLWILLMIISYSYERTLLPLYGSVPTNLNLNRVLFTVIMAAMVTPPTVAGFITPKKLPGADFFFVSAPLLLSVPTMAYWVALYTSRIKDPVLGPVITHVIVLVPIAYLFAVTAINLNGSVYLSRNLPNLSQSFSQVLLIIWFIFRPFNPASLQRFSYLSTASDEQTFFYVSMIITVGWMVHKFIITRYVPAPMNKTTLKRNYGSNATIGITILLFLTPFMFTSPVLRRPLRHPLTHPIYPLRILSSTRSTTGQIVVGEILRPTSATDLYKSQLHSLRYLRASHSLIGGVWIRDKAMTIDGSPSVDNDGTPLGDSIYSAFALQEAARLVDNAGGSGNNQTALIIGLGAGISASAFSRHGINTTIVEIDPAVYHAARRWFQMPPMSDVFLEDARGWVTGRRRKLDAGVKQELFNIVVHDCFSGGGVPKHIFTKEFWADLKELIQPDGVLAVNFVGRLASSSSIAVTLTLQSVFGICRAFHDSAQILTEDQYHSEFVNIVFFCVNTPGDNPPTFRPSRTGDYLNSHLRKHILSSLAEREVNLSLVTANLGDEKHKNEWILTDASNPLGGWMKQSALEHWKLMRETLPDWVWETY